MQVTGRRAQALVSSYHSQNLHPAPWLGCCSGARALSLGFCRCWSCSQQMETAHSPCGSEVLGPLQWLQWLAGKQEAPQKPGAVPQQAGAAPQMDLEYKNSSVQHGWNGFVHHHFVGAYCYPLLLWTTDLKSISTFHRTGMERNSKTYRSLNPSCKPKLQILKESNKPSSVAKALLN